MKQFAGNFGQSGKKYFKFGQRVKIVNTNSDLDGDVGYIDGLASVDVLDVYIVRFDMVHETSVSHMIAFQSVAISETNLEPDISKVSGGSNSRRQNMIVQEQLFV